MGWKLSKWAYVCHGLICVISPDDMHTYTQLALSLLYRLYIDSHSVSLYRQYKIEVYYTYQYVYVCYYIYVYVLQFQYVITNTYM